MKHKYRRNVEKHIGGSYITLDFILEMHVVVQPFNFHMELKYNLLKFTLVVMIIQ